MSNFTFKQLKELPGLVLIKPRVFSDERGFFLESYKKSDFFDAGIKEKFVQTNQSFSKKNVIRALHYQLNPKAQGKLVGVVTGRIWDVAVDLRKESPNFGKWYGVELSGENHLRLYIPPGFGHGFASLSDDVNFVYQCTKEYSQELEKGIRFDDPDLGIDWKVIKPILGERDKNLPLLRDAGIL